MSVSYKVCYKNKNTDIADQTSCSLTTYTGSLGTIRFTCSASTCGDWTPQLNLTQSGSNDSYHIKDNYLYSDPTSPVRLDCGFIFNISNIPEEPEFADKQTVPDSSRIACSSIAGKHIYSYTNKVMKIIL